MKQQKSYGRIRETELDRVAELHSRGYGVTATARELGRAKSSISELIALNKDGRDGVFRAALAARRRVERKLRQRKRVKLVVNEYIYVRARGTLREDLIASLRKPQRHRGQRRRRAVLQGALPNLTSIDERPAGVLTRRIPGHWESDLIVGKGHKSALISLVERKFRYTMLVRITSLDAETFTTKMTEVLNGLPQKLRRIMTHDNGKEITKAFDIETKTGIRVCVAHPRSPWERGANENTNGLVREFFPKGTDFRIVTDDDVTYVQELLNSRPRKTLAWATPSEVLLKRSVRKWPSPHVRTKLSYQKAALPPAQLLFCSICAGGGT